MSDLHRPKLGRRGFLGLAAALLVAPDPDKLLWRPGARLISVPSDKKLITARTWLIWAQTEKNPKGLDVYSTFADLGPLYPFRPVRVEFDSRYVQMRAEAIAAIHPRHKYIQWTAFNGPEIVSGEIHA